MAGEDEVEVEMLCERSFPITIAGGPLPRMTLHRNFVQNFDLDRDIDISCLALHNQYGLIRTQRLEGDKTSLRDPPRLRKQTGEQGIAFAIGSVFNDPAKRIGLTMMYPASVSTGLNISGVLWVFEPLQTMDKGMRTPIDCQVEDDVVVPPGASE